MELSYVVNLTVGNDFDCGIKTLVAEHDLTSEDLQEFVKEQGFKTPTDYFMYYIDEGSEEENKKYFNKFIAPYLHKSCFLLEMEIKLMCKDEKELRRFLTDKYESQFISKLRQAIDDAKFDLVDLN